MRRLVLLLLAAIGACAPAQRLPFRESAVRASDARADVFWLADPARTGRGAGTPGNAEAAEWLAARMREMHLVPGQPDGYLQPFDAPVKAVLKGDNALVLGKSARRVEQEWQPFTFSENGSASGELVWVGYGITATDLSYDDYAGLDVKGKVALVAAHFPRESDERSPFRAPNAYRYGEWRYKAMNARDHGAVALVAVRDDWNHAGADVLPKWQGTVSAPAGILAARATLGALASAGVDARELAKPGSEDGKPHSRALGIPVKLSVDIERQRARTANVVGLLPGTDPARKDECVVVGAHYDHLGYGGETSLAPEQFGQVHPGADDNASGVAAMLAIARAFTEEGPAPRTVAFVAFSGEELGLLGSSRFVKSPPPACPIEKTRLMVNLDMVGRAQNGKVYVDGAETAKGLRSRVQELARLEPALPIHLAFGAGDGYGPSDHTSFYAKGVPVLFFFTGAHADYHRPSDTPDKINADGLVAVARLALRVAASEARSPERLEVVHTPPPPGTGERGGEREGGRSYGAYLGTIPDFAERAEPGVLLSAVRPSSPAEKAGLAAGDVVIRLAGRPVRNLEDLAYVLREHRPGDVVEIVWQRGSDVRKAQVTLQERK
jgi:aminopeptidase YwaD